MPEKQPPATTISAVPGRTPMFEDSTAHKAELFDWHLTRTWWVFFEQLRKAATQYQTGTGGTDSGSGGSTATVSAGPFIRTLLIKDTAIGVDVTDHIIIFGGTDAESNTLKRVSLVLRKPIAADLTVKLNLYTAAKGTQTIGTFTVPSATAVNTPVVSTSGFVTATLPDLGVIWGDIAASDGSKDVDGICSLTLEWSNRSAGTLTTAGLAWQGGWDPATRYATNDIVSWQGSTWISVKSGNQANQPDLHGDYWALLAEGSPHGFGASFDGGGSALSAGAVAYTVAPKGGTISKWSILVDQGACTVKVWKVASGTAIPTAADSINTSGVAISTGTAIESNTVTDFTAHIVADGDIVAVTLSAVSGGATKVNFLVELW